MITVMAAADWLAVLDYGTFEVAEDGRQIPILGYVIAAGERIVLVDTGFPPAYAVDPDAAARRDGLHSFGRLVAIGPEHLPAGQLALLGLEPRDVTHLVITHGDIDHVGGMDAFPHATLITSRVEHDSGPPRYFGDVCPIDWPDPAQRRLVDGDLELAPGVTLLATPGHSPGHLSLLVRLGETGAIVLACDAISRGHELESGVNGGASDLEQARWSAQRLVAIAAAENALLVYGHDPKQRRALRLAPAVYR